MLKRSWLIAGMVAALIIAFSGLCIGAVPAIRGSTPEFDVSDPGLWADTSRLAESLETQVHRWRNGLFLEAYGISYKISDSSPVTISITDEAYFRFAGWRTDSWGRVLARWNANHAIARVSLDTEMREVTEVSYSNGEPFGYDAPLNVAEWSLSDLDLLRHCETSGGENFRERHQIDYVRVTVESTRPGRFWEARYDASSTTFECLIHLETDEVSVRLDMASWIPAESIVIDSK